MPRFHSPQTTRDFHPMTHITLIDTNGAPWMTFAVEPGTSEDAIIDRAKENGFTAIDWMDTTTLIVEEN